MGRGGIGARRALAERVAKSNRYALTGVARGTRVAECYDAYRRWEFGARLGTITGRVGQRIIVVWDDAEGPEAISDGDARYWVDTNRWRLTGPTQRTVFDAMARDTKVSPPVERDALTRVGKDESMSISPQPRRQTEGEQENMAESTLSAKQVATKLGTDAKTFRRFLRSSSCTVDPVGQGGRYEFDKEDLPALTKQFTAWRKPGAKKAEPKVDAPAKPKKPKSKPVQEVDEDEPTDEELADIDDELEDLEFEDLV